MRLNPFQARYSVVCLVSVSSILTEYLKRTFQKNMNFFESFDMKPFKTMLFILGPGLNGVRRLNGVRLYGGAIQNSMIVKSMLICHILL